MVNVKVSSVRYRVLVAMCLGLSAIPQAQAAPIYTFPIPTSAGCAPHYARYHHDYPANDILAKKGCKYVAVTSGTIDEIRNVDTYNYKKPTPLTKGGIYVSFVGDDGVRYYGSHLSKIPSDIEPGVRVEAGHVIGFVGQSGDAKGLASHVHFGISWNTKDGIWWVRRGEIYPWKYLDLWKAGKDANPAAAVAKQEKKIGTVPAIPKY